MNLDPKVSQKFHKGEIKNNVLILKTQKKIKKKAFEQNIKRKYQNRLGCPLILKKPFKNNVNCKNELQTKEVL
jgi:hypothetical protein